MKNQIRSLLDYKDSYHICLLGLDRGEDQQASFDNHKNLPDRKGKISIRQFHEYVLRFLVVELIRQGFKYVSTLPTGFQQVHDLAQIFGFQLIDHEDNTDINDPARKTKEQESSLIDTPITVSL